MKHLTAFALAVLSCVPAFGQFRGMGGMGGRPATPAQSIEAELLEMEQEADKSALREAFLAQAQQGMRPVPESRPEKVQLAVIDAALRDFIAKKKEAIFARAAAIRKVRGATPVSTPSPSSKADSEAALEKLENAQVETQLLEAQIGLLQPDLTKAIEALAAADFAATKDEAQQPKAAAARKGYEQIKARFVEHSKRLQMEQRELRALQQTMGISGMGMGGMAGMGGGMR